MGRGDMKRSPIWDQPAHTPVLDVIAVEHVHNKAKQGCRKVRILTTGADVHGFRIHLFHDDANRLYVVKLPSA